MTYLTVRCATICPQKSRTRLPPFKIGPATCTCSAGDVRQHSNRHSGARCEECRDAVSARRIRCDRDRVWIDCRRHLGGHPHRAQGRRHQAEVDLYVGPECIELAATADRCCARGCVRNRNAVMFKVRVIPCLDVKDGRVVKGVNFVNLRDAGDPVQASIAYDAAGADELCFLDITASHENRDTIYDVVTRTAEACFMPLTVGGGVRTVEDIRKLLTLSLIH